MRKIAALACLSGALLSCADPPATGGDVAVGDSAGVSIVENAPARLERAPRWRLAPEPAMEIATPEEGEGVLHDVADLAVLSDGRVAVLVGAQEVLVFDRAGSLVLRVGGEGDGPGEFTNARSVLALPGDSIGVYGSDHRRLSVFAGDGSLGREVTLADVPPSTAFALLMDLGDGELAVFTQGGMQGHGPGVFRAVSESFVVGLDGTKRASLGSFPGTEVFQGQYGGAVGGPVLFGAATHAAAAGGRLVVGTGHAPEVRVHAPGGEPVTVVRWPDHDREVNQERFGAFLEAVLAEVPGPARANARAMFEAVPRSDEEPAHGPIVGTHDGRFWVAPYQGPEAILPGFRPPARTWKVFEGTGHLAATVETPEGFAPLAVTGDTVLGVFVDELGVETVRAYAIEAPSG